MQIKIEHVDPSTSRSIAFDIMRSATAKDPDGKPVTAPEEIAETFVLRHGQFKVLSLSGNLVLREVSEAELAERERVVREEAELRAEVARETAAKAEAERVAKLEAERAERKAEIERLAAGGADGSTVDVKRAAADRAAAEHQAAVAKAAAETDAAKKAEADRVVAEKKAAADKATAELNAAKDAADKAETDRLAAANAAAAKPKPPAQPVV